MILYNQSESTNIDIHSLFWILYVTITLSMNRVELLEHSDFSEEQEKEEELFEYG
jgi:hypothetical protein